MGFQDQAADSGAELTSLKKNSELLPVGSAGSSLDLVGLTKPKEKDKDFDLNYEPVRYAVGGAQPEAGGASTNVEIQQPKRFGGSSMARNVIEEPNGQAFGMAGFKKDVSATQVKKMSGEGEVQISKLSLGGEPAVYDKKLIPDQPSFSKKALPDDGTYLQQMGQGASAHRNFNEEPVVEKSKTGFGNAAEMGSELKVKPGSEGSSFVQKLPGGTSAGEFGASTIVNTQLPAASGERITAAAERGAGASEKITGTSGRSLSFDQGFGGGTMPTGLHQPNEAAALKPGIQTQIPALASEQLEAKKFLPGAQTQFVESGLKQSAEIPQINRAAALTGEPLTQTTFTKPVVTQPVLTQPGSNRSELQQALVRPESQQAFVRPELQQAIVRPELQQVLKSEMKGDQAGVRTEPATSRVAALNDMNALRRQEPSTSTVRGGNLAAVDRTVNTDFAPPSVRKLAQGSEIGVQTGALKSGLTTRTIVADSAAELPRGFSRANAQLSHAEKFTPDVQLRAQTDRIAAGAQVKAQADQPANTGIKLKGEVVANSVTANHVTANNIRPQDIAVPANIKAHEGVVANQVKLQDAIVPNTIRHQDIVAPVKVGQQFDASMQPRFSPLTGKSAQDLVQALRPQDRIAAARTNSAELTISTDRRIAASVIRTGADALTPPVATDRNVRTGNAHIVAGDNKVFTGDNKAFTGDNKALAGDAKVFTGKLNTGTTASDVVASDRKPISSAQLIALLTNLKESREIIARTPAFDPLMAGTLKSTKDRYVGGEFLLASMIIAAGAARRMPEQRAEANGTGQTPGQTDGAQVKRGDKFVVGQPQVSDAANSNKTVKPSAFAQIVDTISRAFTNGRPNEQQTSVEATRRAHTPQQIGQPNESVRYITGVELAILLAAGGVSRLRSDKVEAPNSAQLQADAATKTAKAAQGVSPLPSAPFVRAERCIPGTEVAVAAMLMLGGMSKKRNEERFPANPNELAEKVDRSFRIDRRIGLGEAIAQVKSFVAREPLPVSGMRATAAEIVSRGDVVVPPQYKQGATNNQSADLVIVSQQNKNIQDASATKKAKTQPEIIAALPVPTGWVHEPVLESSTEDGYATEETLKKVEQDQQEGAGTGANQTLYRPMWIIAPGETFVSIAEDHFGDGSIAWLIADINIGKFSESFVEGKRVIEIQSRQRIELPVAGDIETFRHNRKRHMDAENLVTIVTASQLDLELKQATFKQFLGTLQAKLPLPSIAQLPELDLGTASQPKPLRPVAAFGMSAPQFASIAAAVSLPLILPQIDMLQSPADATSVHVQEIRTAGENAKPEEQV